MITIFKRELKSYFNTPIGWFLLFLFTLTCAILFVFGPLSQDTTQMTNYFQLIINYVLMIYAPILTMRLLSEEKKLKTDQLLLTSPRGLLEITLGKFFSVYAFLLISFIPTFIFSLTTYFYGKPDTGLLITQFVALILVGGSFLSLGLFISALTESQVVAAFATFGIVLALLLLQVATQSINNPSLSAILNTISLYSRINNFSQGMLSFASILYYLSFMTVFVFFTVRMLDKKRYS